MGRTLIDQRGHGRRARAARTPRRPPRAARARAAAPAASCRPRGAGGRARRGRGTRATTTSALPPPSRVLSSSCSGRTATCTAPVGRAAQVEDAQLGLHPAAARHAGQHVHLAHELRRPARGRRAVHLHRRARPARSGRRASPPAGRPARAPPPGRASRAARWPPRRAGSARPRGAARRAASRRGSRTARPAARARARAPAPARAPRAGARRRTARTPGSVGLVLEPDELERPARVPSRSSRGRVDSPNATFPSTVRCGNSA